MNISPDYRQEGKLCIFGAEIQGEWQEFVGDSLSKAYKIYHMAMVKNNAYEAYKSGEWWRPNANPYRGGSAEIWSQEIDRLVIENTKLVENTEAQNASSRDKDNHGKNPSGNSTKSYSCIRVERWVGCSVL